MENTDDIELLREYAARDSQPAFETLVQRHVDLVYSAALRQVGDPVLAGEVTQTVFIILARKARTLRQSTILSGWLYRTAQLAAGRALRTESRRRKYEQEAAQMETEQSDSTWQHIAPFLDEAMARLGDTDRTAVVLRYFEDKNLSDVGNALGTNERAAQKRVARAVEKLRAFFTKRGVVVPAVLVTSALSANAVTAAPAGVVSSVVAVAAAKGGIVSASTLTLIKGTLKLMAWTKLKTAAVVGVVVLLTVGTATVTVRQIKQHRIYPWQVANGISEEALKALNTAPPQVTIIRSRFTTGPGRGDLIDDHLKDQKDQWRYIGIHSTPSEIIGRAYWDGDLRPTRIILPSDMPDGSYDYIANLTNGSQQALQGLIKEKFGLVAKVVPGREPIRILLVEKVLK